MHAGVVGVVDGTFERVDSYQETVADGDNERTRCFTIDGVFSLPSGGMAFEGRAAAETVVRESTASIEGGEIRTEKRERTVTTHTEFVGVPGEFVVVGSGDGAFAFDLIGAETGTTIERTGIDLDGFYAAHGDARPWRAGFHGTGDDGVNGIFHGQDLRAEIRDRLDDSTLNQLGLVYDYDGTEVKMTATSSGYVEVYQPADFDSGQFLEYVQAEFLPHVR